MRHDEDALVLVPGGDRGDGSHDAFSHCLPGLAVVLLPGETLLDFGASQTGPGADVDLAQSRLAPQWDVAAGVDDLGGLGRPPEVARINRVQLQPLERAGQLARLRPAGFVQRRVGVALVPAVPVPVGLSMPHEDELGHSKLG